MNSASILKNTESDKVISLGLKHHGCELLRIRLQYPSLPECPILESIVDFALSYAREGLKNDLLSLPEYHLGIRAKYSLTVTAEPVAKDILYITVSADFSTNSKDIPPITEKQTLLYSTAQGCFVLSEYILPQLADISEKRVFRRLVTHLKRRGAWYIKRGELFLVDKGKPLSAGRLSDAMR